MRVWYTFGGFGSTVAELSWFDFFRLLIGQDVEIKGTGMVLSLGKSHLKSLGEAPSRERQLNPADEQNWITIESDNTRLES